MFTNLNITVREKAEMCFLVEEHISYDSLTASQRAGIKQVAACNIQISARSPEVT